MWLIVKPVTAGCKANICLNEIAAVMFVTAAFDVRKKGDTDDNKGRNPEDRCAFQTFGQR